MSNRDYLNGLDNFEFYNAVSCELASAELGLNENISGNTVEAVFMNWLDSEREVENSELVDLTNFDLLKSITPEAFAEFVILKISMFAREAELKSLDDEHEFVEKSLIEWLASDWVQLQIKGVSV